MKPPGGTETPGTTIGPVGGGTGTLVIPQGLNPGWMQATPTYHTTDPAQAKYYWGSHPFQAGSTFDAGLAAQGINAPAQAWGAQTSARAPTGQEMIDYYKRLGHYNPFDPNSQFYAAGPISPNQV